MARSRRSRFTRIAAVLIVTVVLCGAGARGASAAKSDGVITGQLPAATSNPTPPSTVMPTAMPVNVSVSGAAPVNSSGDNSADTTGSTGDYVNVSVTVRVCPKNYKTFDATNDFNKAMNDCVGTPSGVPIHMIDGAGVDHRYVAGGRVTWHDVPAGPIYIKGEDDPKAIQPFSWCEVDDGRGWWPGGVSDDATLVVLLPNYTLSCIWFVTPMFKLPGVGVVNGGVMAPPDLGSPVADGGSLTINSSSACPAGFDAASADIYGLAANCHDPAPARTVTVVDSSGAQNQTQDGIASFGPIAAGPLTATIHLSSGWIAPRVFCKSRQGDAEQEAAVFNFSWTLNILPNQDAYCDVFSIAAPAQSGATIISAANFCYDGMLDGNYSQANLASACFPDPNVTIVAFKGDQQIGQATTANGAATITGLPAGDVRLQGLTPETPIVHVLVYCKVRGAGNSHLVNAAVGSIHLNVVDGEATDCAWFFITPGFPNAG